MAINKIALSKAIQSIIRERKYSPVHNCHLIAALTQKILTIYRVESKIVGGHAIWRVNNFALSGVCARFFDGGKFRIDPFGVGSFFWVESNNCIVDYSTFWLPTKMAIIDRNYNNRKTLVMWRPDFIWMPKDKMLSWYDVTHGMKMGGHYRPEKGWNDKFVHRLEFTRKLFFNGDPEHDYHLPLISDLLEDTLQRYREFQ